jgi:hypothetical protein
MRGVPGSSSYSKPIEIKKPNLFSSWAFEFW